jgi:Protein DA1
MALGWASRAGDGGPVSRTGSVPTRKRTKRLPTAGGRSGSVVGAALVVSMLVSAGGGSGGSAFGRVAKNTTARTSSVSANGLPATVFDSVLAHEMGHAWLAGCPDVGREEASEEGICELVASWWLRERGGRLAAYRLDAMMANPDPV